MSKWKIKLKDQEFVPINEIKVEELINQFQPPYKDQFLPISVTAEIFKVSTQTIRLLISSGKVNVINPKTGPVLVSLEDVYLLRGSHEKKRAKRG